MRILPSRNLTILSGFLATMFLFLWNFLLYLRDSVPDFIGWYLENHSTFLVLIPASLDSKISREGHSSTLLHWASVRTNTILSNYFELAVLINGKDQYNPRKCLNKGTIKNTQQQVNRHMCLWCFQFGDRHSVGHKRHTEHSFCPKEFTIKLWRQLMDVHKVIGLIIFHLFLN